MKASQLTMLIDEMSQTLKKMENYETIMRAGNCPMACMTQSIETLKQTISILKIKRDFQVKKYMEEENEV